MIKTLRHYSAACHVCDGSGAGVFGERPGDPGGPAMKTLALGCILTALVVGALAWIYSTGLGAVGGI
jgi:hypothetical protein